MSPRPGRESRWRPLLAGVFLGLGLATKISVAPILAAYFVAHFMAAFGLVGSDDSPDAPFMERIFIVGGNAVIAAIQRSEPGGSGRYFHVTDERGPQPQAEDRALARDLWERSLTWTGLGR